MPSARASRALRRVAAAALALAAVAGCANLDGLTGGSADGGGSDDAGAHDGSVGTDAGGAPDARSTSDAPPGPPDGADAAAVDASAPRDAAEPADAPVDTGRDAPTPPADAGSWCSQQSPAPTFCADFDTSLTAGFTATNQVGGTISQDPNDFVSSPYAMLSVTNAAAASSVVQASQDYAASATGSVVHLEYQLRQGELDPNADLVAGGVAIVPAGGNAPDLYHLFLVLSAGESYVEEEYDDGGGQQFKDTALSETFPANQFVKVELDLVLPKSGGPAPTATVRFGNDVVLDALPLFQGGANGTIDIEVGASVYPSVAVGQCQVDVDDVLLDISP